MRDEIARLLAARETYRTPLEKVTVLSEAKVDAGRSYYVVRRKTGETLTNVPGPSGISDGALMGFADGANGQRFEPVLIQPGRDPGESVEVIEAGPALKEKGKESSPFIESPDALYTAQWDASWSAQYWYRSTDGGSTWDLRGIAAGAGVEVDAAISLGVEKLLAINDDDVVSLSTDGGLTWTDVLNDGATDSADFMIYAGNGVILLEGESNSPQRAVRRSTDYGLTWDAPVIAATYAAVSLAVYMGGGVVMGMTPDISGFVARASESVGYQIGPGTRTIEIGVIRAQNGSFVTDYSNIVFTGAYTEEYYAGNPVSRTFDDFPIAPLGAQSGAGPCGLQYYRAWITGGYSANAQAQWNAGFGGEQLRYYPGYTWEENYFGAGIVKVSGVYTDAGPSDGRVYETLAPSDLGLRNVAHAYSQDRGASWSYADAVTLSPGGCELTMSSAIGPTLCAAGILLFQTYRSIDGGRQWQYVPALDIGGGLLRFAYLGNGAVLAWKFNGGPAPGTLVLRSSDNGASWETLSWSVPYATRFVCIAPGTVVCQSSDPDDSWLINFWISRDYGSTWTLQGRAGAGQDYAVAVWGGRQINPALPNLYD